MFLNGGGGLSMGEGEQAPIPQCAFGVETPVSSCHSSRCTLSSPRRIWVVFQIGKIQGFQGSE